jgi:hypothetical protein
METGILFGEQVFSVGEKNNNTGLMFEFCREHLE